MLAALSRAVLCLATLAALAAVPSAPLQASPLDEAVDVRILPGWRAADGSHFAAIEMVLAPGWKTYWRAPGDAGIPPQFDWRGSGNLSGVTVVWPTPQAVIQGGVRTIGYAERLVLPLRVRPARVSHAVDLEGLLDIGVCKDVCLPVTLQVAQTLPAGAGAPDPRIAAALADRPYSAAEAGVGRVACTISPRAEGLHLQARIELPATGAPEVAVVEAANPQLWIAEAESTRDGAHLIVETELYHAEGRAFALDRGGIRITVLGSSHAVDIRGCPAG